MSAKILDGKSIALKIQEKLKKEIESLKKEYKKTPTLASIQVGQDAGIQSYVKAQEKLTSSLGIGYQLHTLDKDIREEELVRVIKELNGDNSVTAIILQVPLPGELKTKRIISNIKWIKDVEAMHPENIGRLIYENSLATKKSSNLVIPCTPYAVMALLDSTDVKLKGKEVVIVGHSEIIGKPLSLLLLNEFATVTICHIETKDLKEHVGRAEVLISATGEPNLIKGSWVKAGAIVIDVGTSRIDGKIIGDVEFEEAKKRASYITPVPGGVGPLTVTMLMRNVITLYKEQV